MKSLLGILFLGSFSALGQSSGFPNCAVQLEHLNYPKLVRLVALDEQNLERMIALKLQQEHIDSLKAELDTAKQEGTITAEKIQQLRDQNKLLREQMQEYMKQIDELNQNNSGIPDELKKKED